MLVAVAWPTTLMAPSRHAYRERKCPLLREARTPSVMSSAAWQHQPEWKILDENESVDGVDELGVLLYGHARNAYLQAGRFPWQFKNVLVA